MYNENDELYEVNDYDEDIRCREALIEEAKNLPETADWKEILNLKKRWKRISYWDSAYEEKLSEEFDSYIDVFYAKRKEGYQSNEVLKHELIQRAETLAETDNWNQGSEEMNELMNQWKATGSAGRDTDDQLWDAFNAARQKFFDRKHQHWEELQSKFGNARQVKEDLIKKAAALVDSKDWQKTSEEFRHLMEEWKAVGSAGKEYEDQLWAAFNESRQTFYERRNVYYNELHAEQDQKYEQKKELIAKAKVIVDRNEYTRENTKEMKDLNVEWKTIGSCGKDKEDQVWKEFREIMDAYFNGLKQWNEQKHQQWRQRMMDARSRKQELVQNQKRQIKRMQDEMVGLLGQRAINEMEERIEEKKEFIQQLEEELADIEKRLNEQ